MRHAAHRRASEHVECLEQAQHIVEQDRAVQIGVDNILHSQRLPKGGVFSQRRFEMRSDLLVGDVLPPWPT